MRHAFRGLSLRSVTPGKIMIIVAFAMIAMMLLYPKPTYDGLAQMDHAFSRITHLDSDYFVRSNNFSSESTCADPGVWSARDASGIWICWPTAASNVPRSWRYDWWRDGRPIQGRIPLRPTLDSPRAVAATFLQPSQIEQFKVSLSSWAKFFFSVYPYNLLVFVNTPLSDHEYSEISRLFSQNIADTANGAAALISFEVVDTSARHRRNAQANADTFFAIKLALHPAVQNVDFVMKIDPYFQFLATPKSDPFLSMQTNAQRYAFDMVHARPAVYISSIKRYMEMIMENNPTLSKLSGWYSGWIRNPTLVFEDITFGDSLSIKSTSMSTIPWVTQILSDIEENDYIYTNRWSDSLISTMLSLIFLERSEMRLLADFSYSVILDGDHVENCPANENCSREKEEIISLGCSHRIWFLYPQLCENLLVDQSVDRDLIKEVSRIELDRKKKKDEEEKRRREEEKKKKEEEEKKRKEEEERKKKEDEERKKKEEEEKKKNEEEKKKNEEKQEEKVDAKDEKKDSKEDKKDEKKDSKEEKADAKEGKKEPKEEKADVKDEKKDPKDEKADVKKDEKADAKDEKADVKSEKKDAKDN